MYNISGWTMMKSTLTKHFRLSYDELQPDKWQAGIGTKMEISVGMDTETEPGVMMMVEEESPATIGETFQFLESRTCSEFEFWGVD